jgi:hypothetical protein
MSVDRVAMEFCPSQAANQASILTTVFRDLITRIWYKFNSLPIVVYVRYHLDNFMNASDAWSSRSLCLFQGEESRRWRRMLMVRWNVSSG